MWCVVNRCHPTTGSSYIVPDTCARTKKESLARFAEGRGDAWEFWRKKYNFSCEKVIVHIETIDP